MGQSTPPSDELIPKIISSCPSSSILVGGQALLFWSGLYQIDKAIAGPAATRDVDFVGDYADAAIMAEALGGKIKKPSMDDHTPSTALIYVPIADSNDSVTIDFIDHVMGIADKHLKKSPEVDFESVKIHVLHPIDCLISRIINLARLPEKRSPEGIAQAKLAIVIARRWFENTLDGGEDRNALKEVKRLIKFVKQAEIRNTIKEYEFHIIESIPVDKFPSKFQEKHWPKIRQFFEPVK